MRSIMEVLTGPGVELPMPKPSIVVELAAHNEDDPHAHIPMGERIIMVRNALAKINDWATVKVVDRRADIHDIKQTREALGALVERGSIVTALRGIKKIQYWRARR